jgi:ubiquinone biosynthesis protein
MPTTKIIPYLPRMKEIVSVAVHFGFGEVLRGIKLGDVLGRLKPDNAVENTLPHVRFRLPLEELGPTFIKLGQVLSMRPDYIQFKWADTSFFQ